MRISGKKWFLPVGLLIAVLLGMAWSEPGAWLKESGGISILVVVIFLVIGFRLELRDVKINASLWWTLAAATSISLIGGPFIGLWTGRLLGLTGALAVGLVVAASVPSTLSSGIVITQNSGGNPFWALTMTVGMSFVGVLILPVTLNFSLGGGEDVAISPLKLLIKLALMVLAPFIVGFLARRRLKLFKLADRVAIAPSVCIVVIVWASVSASRDMLMNTSATTLGVVLLGGLTVHFLLMLVCFFVGRGLLRLAPPETKALVFIGSQKTLPVAISVLTALNYLEGLALMVCVIFHFAQIMVDSFIASQWRR